MRSYAPVVWFKSSDVWSIACSAPSERTSSRFGPLATPEELAAFGDEILARLPADEYPHLAQVSRELLDAGFDYRAEFEAGLNIVLYALEARYPGH